MAVLCLLFPLIPLLCAIGIFRGAAGLRKQDAASRAISLIVLILSLMVMAAFVQYMLLPWLKRPF